MTVCCACFSGWLLTPSVCCCSQEVVDFVAAGLAAGRAPTDIASDLLDECVASHSIRNQ